MPVPSMRIVTSSLALFALSAACADDPPASPPVTGPVHHLETQLAPAGDDLAADAADYVAAALSLSADDELAPVSVVRGLDGLRHARLQQVHEGVPVLGSEILVHADDTTFLGYGGTITTHLEGFDIEPALDAAAAAAIAMQTGPGRLESTELVILPRDQEGEGADLAWRVELASPGWTIVVGAETGAVLRQYPHQHPIEQGSGPGGNARVSWTWNAQLDVEPDGADYVMMTDRLLTLDRPSGDMVVRGPLDDLPDPNANDAHGFAEVTLAMMRDWMGVDSIDGGGMPIESVVNDPDPCNCLGDPRCAPYQADNACWHNDLLQMRYGTGGSLFYSLSGGVDVVAHEINHGFTYLHSRLAYGGMAGGLNESFSDIAGTAAEHFHEGDQDDFLIGEDVTQSGDPLRDMCEPTCSMPGHPCLAGQIDHVDGYQREVVQDQNGNDVVIEPDPHTSSGIGNKAFCLAVGRFMAISGHPQVATVQEVARAWYAAQDGRWGSNTTFTQGCQGVVDGARALGYSGEQVLAIAQSWADVGVLCQSGIEACVEDGTCDVVAGETCASCPSDCDSCAEDCSRFKKGKCKVGIGDCSRCGDPSCGDGICDNDEDDGDCGQDCGCAAPGDPCGSVAPFGCFCDEFCKDRGDCCADKEQVCGP